MTKVVVLRNEVTFEGTLGLQSDSGEVKSMFGDAAGRQEELPLVPLSEIVNTLNERFGLNLTDADQLLFDQFEEGWVVDDELGEQARNNSLENFRLVFDRKFLNTIGRQRRYLQARSRRRRLPGCSGGSLSTEGVRTAERDH